MTPSLTEVTGGRFGAPIYVRFWAWRYDRPKDTNYSVLLVRGLGTMEASATHLSKGCQFILQLVQTVANRVVADV